MRVMATLLGVLLIGSMAMAGPITWGWNYTISNLGGDSLVAQDSMGNYYRQNYVPTIEASDSMIPTNAPMYGGTIGLFTLSTGGWTPLAADSPLPTESGLQGRFTFRDEASGQENTLEFLARISLTPASGELMMPMVDFNGPTSFVWDLGGNRFEGQIKEWYSTLYSPPAKGFNMEFNILPPIEEPPVDPTPTTGGPIPGAPEPGTLALAGLGMAMLATRHRLTRLN